MLLQTNYMTLHAVYFITSITCLYHSLHDSYMHVIDTVTAQAHALCPHEVMREIQLVTWAQVEPESCTAGPV